MVRNGPNSVQKLDAKWNPERYELQKTEVESRIWSGFGAQNDPNRVQTEREKCSTPQNVVKPIGMHHSGDGRNGNQATVIGKHLKLLEKLIANLCDRPKLIDFSTNNNKKGK